MRQAQEELLCHNDQVHQAQQADQLWDNNLKDEQLNLLAADLAKTNLIHQYQEQKRYYNKKYNNASVKLSMF